MGLACLKSGPMCCNGSIDDEMQAYPSAPLFQRSKKKTSFKNYRMTNNLKKSVKDQYTVRSTSIISSIVPQHTKLNSWILIYMGSDEKKNK
jgi:hypothetical protein